MRVIQTTILCKVEIYPLITINIQKWNKWHVEYRNKWDYWRHRKPWVLRCTLKRTLVIGFTNSKKFPSTTIQTELTWDRVDLGPSWQGPSWLGTELIWDRVDRDRVDLGPGCLISGHSSSSSHDQTFPESHTLLIKPKGGKQLERRMFLHTVMHTNTVHLAW